MPAVDLTLSGPDVSHAFVGVRSHGHTVVIALTAGSEYSCSGTVIASNVELTAAHCIQRMAAWNTEVFLGQNSYSGVGDYREVSECKAHQTNLESGEAEGDIAIIRLASPAPTAITPIPYLPGRRRVDPSRRWRDRESSKQWHAFCLVRSASRPG